MKGLQMKFWTLSGTEILQSVDWTENQSNQSHLAFCVLIENFPHCSVPVCNCSHNKTYYFSCGETFSTVLTLLQNPCHGQWSQW